MDNIIDGKKIAAKKETELLQKVAQLKIKPKIVSIIVGSDPASLLYTQIKQDKAQELGIEFEALHFSETTNFDQVCQVMENLNKDGSVTGIMVQLPLPENFLNLKDPKDLLKTIDPRKDVDGLTGLGEFLPAVVKAVLIILEEERIEVQNKEVVVIGSSDLVGKPVAQELSKLGGRVSICDRNTANLSEYTQKADLIVSATGSSGLVTADMVKEGVYVIDIGTEKVDGKVVGDVEFETVSKKAAKITPVPGGVGPVTVISLMENVVQSAL